MLMTISFDLQVWECKQTQKLSEFYLLRMMFEIFQYLQIY